MGLTHSTTKEHSSLVNLAISGNEDSIKISIGRYIASYNADVSQLQNFVNLPDKDGNTPLIGAVFGGHLNIVAFLLEKCRADIKIKNKLGCSPVWVASGYSKLSTLVYLVDTIVTMNKQDLQTITKILSETNNSGDSPFLAAVSKGHLDAAKVLYEALNRYETNWISMNDYKWKLLHTQNKAGDTPLSVAVGVNSDLSVMTYLLDAEESCVASGSLNEESICRPLNTKNSKGLTPLMIACERNNVIILKELHKRGSILFTKDPTGRTPLAIASFCGCLDVAEYLLSLEEGKEILDIADNNECTPIWLAARTGNLKMLKLLIQAGADTSTKGAEGLSVREVAKKYKKDTIVDYFTNHDDITFKS